MFIKRFFIPMFMAIFFGICAKAETVVISNCSNPELVLAVPGGNYASGQQLVVWQFHASLADQKFDLQWNSNGLCAVHPQSTASLSLAIPASVIRNNQPVILYTSHDIPDQQWVIEQVGHYKYVIRSSINRDYVLAPMEARNGYGVGIQEYVGSASQQWNIIFTSDEYYKNVFVPKYSH